MDITDIPSYHSIVKQVKIVNVKLVFVSYIGEIIFSIPQYTHKQSCDNASKPHPYIGLQNVFTFECYTKEKYSVNFRI